MCDSEGGRWLPRQLCESRVWSGPRRAEARHGSQARCLSQHSLDSLACLGVRNESSATWQARLRNQLLPFCLTRPRSGPFPGWLVDALASGSAAVNLEGNL